MMLLYLTLLDETGDRELFEDLYLEYREMMLRVALKHLKDRWSAEEAVHQACLKIIEHFDDCKKVPCAETAGWIVIIVRNTCLDYLRKKREVLYDREEGDFEQWADTGWNPDKVREPAVGRETPESQAAYRRLVDLIRSMPETLRGALEMRYVLEWSVREIAQVLGISETAASARVRRGRELLLKKLEEEGYVYD